MADFRTAVAVVLRNEGTKLLNDPETGEYSRYGVTLKTAAAYGFCAPNETEYIYNLTEDRASAFYLRVFWTPLLLAGVKDQTTTDGRMGVETLTAINAADTLLLLTELRAHALGFYHKLVVADPDKYSKYWDAWKLRSQQ